MRDKWHPPSELDPDRPDPNFPTIILGIAVVLATLIALISAALSTEIHVIDGDTVRVGPTVYRLVGYDTPELSSPCTQERYLAQRAKDRLRQLIRDHDHTLTEVRCSCAHGTHGTLHCNYGRSCAILTIEGGLNVSETLIADKLAKPYICTLNKCPKRQPWCL